MDRFKFFGSLGDIGMAAFFLFVAAIIATNYSDKNMGTAIKRPNHQIGMTK